VTCGLPPPPPPPRACCGAQLVFQHRQALLERVANEIAPLVCLR
jgi:hypothetical protein